MAKARYKVAGPFPIVGADGADVPPGGTVELDDTQVNIHALVVSGCVAPIQGKTAEAKADGKSGS
jgi:hypothetical protein